jgi:ubiquinone/menaquinone biosynthesis C-methylase UbiE
MMNNSLIRRLLGKPNIEYEIYEEGRKTEQKIQPIHTINHFFQNGKIILEIGSGTGRAAYELSQQFPNVFIIGGDRALGKELSPHYKNQNLKYVAIDWNNLGLATGSIDNVLIPFSLLFHEPHSRHALMELQRITHQGVLPPPAQCVWKANRYPTLFAELYFLPQSEGHDGPAIACTC